MLSGMLMVSGEIWGWTAFTGDSGAVPAVFLVTGQGSECNFDICAWKS